MLSPLPRPTPSDAGKQVCGSSPLSVPIPRVPGGGVQLFADLLQISSYNQLASAAARLSGDASRGNNKHGGGSRGRKRGDFTPGCRGYSGRWGAGGDLGGPQRSPGPLFCPSAGISPRCSPLGMHRVSAACIHTQLRSQPLPVASLHAAEVRAGRPSPSQPRPREVVMGLRQAPAPPPRLPNLCGARGSRLPAPALTYGPHCASHNGNTSC